MSKIHVLAGAFNVYTVVVHTNVPVGNNSAGILWSDAIINSGRNISTMVPGAGPGQITQTELDQITAGTVMEGTFQWQDDPNWTNAQRMADLDLRASQMTSELSNRNAIELKMFGATRA